MDLPVTVQVTHVGDLHSSLKKMCQELMSMRSLQIRQYHCIFQQYLQAKLQCQKHVFELERPAPQILVPQDESCDGAHVQLHVCL